MIRIYHLSLHRACWNLKRRLLCFPSSALFGIRYFTKKICVQAYSYEKFVHFENTVNLLKNDDSDVRTNKDMRLESYKMM